MVKFEVDKKKYLSKYYNYGYYKSGYYYGDYKEEKEDNDNEDKRIDAWLKHPIHTSKPMQDAVINMVFILFLTTL